MTYDLYSTFNILEHKKTFINYLEVIIYPDGLIEYAIPSHQEKLLNIAMKAEGLTRKQIWDKIPMFDDVMTTLCNMTGCISVWDDFIYQGKVITMRQIAKLKQLKLYGLYRGNIPQINNTKYSEENG